MKTNGEHVTADVWLRESSFDSLNISSFVEDALTKSGMNVLGSAKHDFGIGAFTGVWLLAESHFSIHTFPERNFVSLDCYTCGANGKPLACVVAVLNKFDVETVNISLFPRGV
jgi:S-adenosylmethionine decarboxylase